MWSGLTPLVFERHSAMRVEHCAQNQRQQRARSGLLHCSTDCRSRGLSNVCCRSKSPSGWRLRRKSASRPLHRCREQTVADFPVPPSRWVVRVREAGRRRAVGTTRPDMRQPARAIVPQGLKAPSGPLRRARSGRSIPVRAETFRHPGSARSDCHADRYCHPGRRTRRLWAGPRRPA